MIAQPGASRRTLLAQPLLLGLGFLLLIAMSASTVWLARQSTQNAQVVAQSLEVQNRLTMFLLHMRRTESAQRGYLLTGQQDYRRRYDEYAAQILTAFEALRAATRDNAQRQAALTDIERLTTEKYAEMSRSIALIDAGDRDGAIALVARGDGQNLMDDIRARLLALYADENKTLSDRQQASLESGFYFLVAALAATALLLLVAALSIFMVQRSGRQSEEARKAVETANASLEQRVADRTAALREANEEIQRFAYIVSHDLRSPLVNIMGFTAELEALKTDILATAGTPEPAAEDAAGQTETLHKDFDEALGFIKSSIGKMDRLIGSILRLSREGRRNLHPEPVDLQPLLNTIAETVSHQLAEKGAELSVGFLPAIVTDRLAVEQIFSNLLDNAVKYLDPGRPGRITVNSRDLGHFVAVEIEDNGRGIAPADHDRVFDLFRRAGAQDRPGEGIGLAHVRALVRRLGGHITLRSEENRGTTFTVTLPRRLDAERE